MQNKESIRRTFCYQRWPKQSPAIVGGQCRRSSWKCGDTRDDAKGFTYHLAGDDVFTTEEIVEFVLESIQTDVQKLYISPERAEAMGMFYEQIWDPKCTRDSLRLWQEDCVLNAQYGERTISDLGVKPRSMKREAFNYLIRFRKGGHFIEL